ncbi:hypothetical protein J502_1112 [Acinetobacter sp. 1294596]|uniref:Uncharacterized protein n=1 Tax=Acinetobacter radioresistens SK82 TaxID=596318 RepID=A0ABM9YQ86_ACIRA|nr:hypothetical protein ACIRA0001_0972 [Acinetobacter radioresistens SK82]EEY88112.1 hypothetical protein HMPREF0018_00859 [Acinetobacter radioresistens SH164]EJO34602.1 hypothetical protein ACINWCA157_1165 [Acinetobacter radioresistens WC-A-157]EXB71365.1 hypothetical protein J550_2141 [Acinetobacter sp. 230853]EXB87461.1 hypothetical protein J538_0647 [Acinetobacter sp. 272263]EXC33518.1 hypothetical protein J520_0992 [Acinetobacter sp. 869535]EXE13441.1 hypothetical protein J559_2320 [Acin
MGLLCESSEQLPVLSVFFALKSLHYSQFFTLFMIGYD